MSVSPRIGQLRGPHAGAIGSAQEIATGAVLLASAESSFMTGAGLLLDGGSLAFKGSAAPLSGNGAGSDEET